MNGLKYYFLILLPVLLGVFTFVFITGGKIISPTYVDWLLNTNDAGNSFIAWQFFRYTPLLQSPLASNYPYGMGIAGSISYAEPLLLFAIPFKLISNLLPKQFQYVGLWLLLCFILQIVFSWQLLAKITKDNYLKFLASAFFALAPPFIYRLYGHPDFLGQWLVVAGILFYFSDRYRKFAWPSFIAIAGLVHPYLLLMLLILWCADLIHRMLLRELGYKEVVKSIFFINIMVLLIIWQGGYLMMPSHDIATVGFGLYRMNLLSPFNPRDDIFLITDWSHILKALPRGPGDFEGFMYLGLGVILLAVIGLSRCLELENFKVLWNIFKKNTVLLFTGILLTLFALSNHIAFGSYELFQYRLPEIVSVFRASGRFFLPVFYLTYFLIFYLIIKTNRKNTARILIGVCLIIQLIDSSTIYSQFRTLLSQAKPYEPSLQNLFWKQAAKNYKKIIYVLPGPYKFSLKPLVYYASSNRLLINIGYFARTNLKKIEKNKQYLIDNILHSEFDKDALYVFNDKNLLNLFSPENIKVPYHFYFIDNFFVFAPGENLQGSYSDLDLAAIRKYAYKLGTTIDFATEESNFTQYAFPLMGFSVPEGKRTWTVGDTSILLIRLAEKPNTDLLLEMDAVPFITEKHPALDVEVLGNEHHLEYLHFNIKDKTTLSKITIPQSVIKDNNLLKLELHFKYAASPAQIGISTDERRLGLFLSYLKIDVKK